MEIGKINNNKYTLEELKVIIEEPNIEQEKNVYGWVLEYKYGDLMSSFEINWTKKVYDSKKSALNALVQVSGTKTPKNARISPIYKMNNSEYREYKINEVLGESKYKKNSLKAWKLKEDYKTDSKNLAYQLNNISGLYKKGSVFIQLENNTIIKSGNCKEKTKYYFIKTLFNKFLELDILEEIDIKEEKWIYPHLLKEVKSLIK